MECLCGCLRRKKIKLLLLTIIFVAGSDLILNSHNNNFFNKINDLKIHGNENASLSNYDIGYNKTEILLSSNKINIKSKSQFDNKNFSRFKSSIKEVVSLHNEIKGTNESQNDSITFAFSSSTQISNISSNDASIRNEENEELRTEERKSIKYGISRQESFQRRKLKVAEECQKLNIMQDDFSGGSWGTSECHPTVSEHGYKECINPKHFPLARSSSAMTCIINKVASTSIATLFLENDGQMTPSLSDSSPHNIVTSITATRKEEFLFAKKHFFKFLIVRDPFERLLSAYVDKVVIANHWSLLDLRADILKFVVEHKGYLSNKFVKVDSSLVNKNGVETHNVTNGSQDSYVPSFQEFLEYILNTNLEGDGFESHWVPYWKWCAPCTMQYDFIAKLDSSPSDLEFIWNRMSVHDKERIPWLNKSFKKRQELGELKTEHYSLLSLKTIAEIYKKFSVDFTLFDYDVRDVLIKGNHCSNNNCENIMQKYFLS